ncbi:esterase-like activity of phytase family protein [Streptomyces minutiscleroticus]|uniref:Lipoprotein n=1 Tax=Streptomyces minutiscleroticus TaxID=68238 RepID=A0A918KIJ4_9ACTN|nr:esterase-like activity of phytase family protein [Streptomyces minutiscleroticus]GGX64341.1 lipoprotein [Streptomyces minutiscleroticus]
MRLRTALATATAALAAATCLTAAGPARAAAPGTAQGAAAGTAPGGSRACSPSTALAGFSDALDKTTYEGTFVGNLSALAVDRGGSVAALSDRSSLFTLDAWTLAPRSVVRLADGGGAALDSEGLAVDRDGTRLVSSEGEPAVRRYTPGGRLLGSLPVPGELRVAPAGRAVPNGTFEGLTLLPGGKRLLAGMEYALAGDAADIVRLQTWERKGGKGKSASTGTGGFRLGAQYGYRADAGLGVAETTATPDGRLLVLERGFTSGVGNTVRLYLADLRHAADTRGVEALTGQDGVRLVRKTLLADLVGCPSLGATAKQPQPNPLLDNIEGLAVTGRERGRLKLLLVSDDNQGATQTTRLYSLTVRLPNIAEG